MLAMVDDRRMAFILLLSFPTSPKTSSSSFLKNGKLSGNPSLSQAQRLKKFSLEGKLSEDVIMAVMSEEKKDIDKVRSLVRPSTSFFQVVYPKTETGYDHQAAGTMAAKTAAVA
jgi:hypothetical protein